MKKILGRELNKARLIRHVAQILSHLRPCLVPKDFPDSPSHRIFVRMYGTLNVDENKN